MPDPNLKSLGLLGKNMITGDGKHLYHATLPPVIAYTQSQYEAAVEAGYAEEYVPQEYPKHIPDVGTALNAEHEAQLKGEQPKSEAPSKRRKSEDVG